MNNTNTYSTGKKIKAARIDANMTIVNMAKSLNLARQTYTYLENGQVDPRFLLLQKIATLTKKPLSYFYEHQTSDNLEHERLINASRREGTVYACLKLAELFERSDLAQNLLDTLAIDIKQGRPKDVQKFRQLIDKQNNNN